MPVTVLKGVGDKTKQILEKIEIHSINDLLHYYPRTYEGKKEIVYIKDIVVGEVNLISATVCEKPTNFRNGSLVITRLRVQDETGKVLVTWFKQPYLKDKFRSGDQLLLLGKVVSKNSKLQFITPKVLKKEDQYITSTRQLFPIYPLTKNISNHQMSKLIQASISYMDGRLKDFLPKEIKNRFGLCEINYAISQIHNPDNQETLSVARKRLVFDEFLLFQLGIGILKDERIVTKNNFKMKNTKKTESFLENLPFELTSAQKKVYGEILKDMKGKQSMNRLIQGDVGSGKTIIAILSLLLAVENGYQGCMMVPTEVLAKQHFESLIALLEPLGIKVGLLVGSLTKKEKERIYESLLEGTIDIIIGTHAIIQDKVAFRNLALVITDEQHRFGVRQRERLTKMGNYPHTLVMSATPIPRTLALIVYGDMDVSVIDELPKGRKEIKTHVVNSGYRERIYKFLVDEIEQGRQVYVICPMVEENEELDLESVVEYSEKLKQELPKTVAISYLHGKMKAKEKANIMTSFAEGHIDILVSTTVIEVGVNVPNASVILIENSERFGLAQLHQLRGRVGRGAYQSHCILLSDSNSKIAKERMQVMKKYIDGFVIAEYDLKLRGPGDTFGIKQHGLPEFKIGNIFDDLDILKETSEVAKEILNSDMLKKEENVYLNTLINEFYNQKMTHISL
jgi:ATP-dependent DNA helicase RecG